MKKIVVFISGQFLHFFMAIFFILVFFDYIIPVNTAAQDFININSSKDYQVNNYVRVTNTGGTLSKVVIIMPLPQSNFYQKINSIDTHSGAVLDIPDSEDRYLRYTVTENLPGPGETRTFGYNFNITLHNITIDLDVPEILYDYDVNSEIYQWFTGTSGNIVDPLNPDIKAIADPIWNNSPHIVYFAEKCYEYVAQNFQYLNPEIGLSPLATVLANGGGDCGNLSSIFISLLRYKKIPARHAVAMRPDGSYHVWAEFYLENYGWVPVDVTFKMSSPSRNYFGYYDGNCIVVNNTVAMW
ncbi:transglutaminase domain-containing protein [candidate division KSB1 bacterium]|nr:transglutaminase domain-containing protein [candidate division KSB1 bacterium]